MVERSFKDAYGVLQKHAETLRNQREPNIDDLLKIVTESVDAYGVCKSRIDAVEKALEVALGPTGQADPDDGVPAGGRGPRAAPPARDAG